MTAAREELEPQVLRALCQGTPEGSVRAFAKRQLQGYRWSDPAREILFQCLLELATDNPALLRAELPARLTRRGFPDVAWEEFFQPPTLAKQEAERLIRQLAGTA